MSTPYILPVLTEEKDGFQFQEYLSETDTIGREFRPMYRFIVLIEGTIGTKNVRLQFKRSNVASDVAQWFTERKFTDEKAWVMPMGASNHALTYRITTDVAGVRGYLKGLKD